MSYRLLLALAIASTVVTADARLAEA